MRFCKIDAHGYCFRAVFEGASVDPVREWHPQWASTGSGVWHIVLPNEHTHDVPVAEKYADWPPIALLDVDPANLGIELHPVVTYIGNHLWLKGGPSPFLVPSELDSQIRTHSLTDRWRRRREGIARLRSG
jgi:hypothetical protein